MESRKRALGRGLEQLFNSDNLDLEALETQIYETTSNEEIIELPLEELRPNPYQPRKTFKDESLDELAASIKEHGVFQPIIVKKSIKGYEIIAGERRYRASKKAGLKKIPAIVRHFTDEQMMEIALLENLQRENLNAIEEAEAYTSMIEKLGITQEELSKKIGKSRSYISNTIGLLRLPKEVQKYVISGKLSMSHARTLSKLDDDEEIVKMAEDIIENKLPVRKVEIQTEKEPKKREKKTRYSEFEYVENLFREKLDTKVIVKENKIEISFTNVADLNRILEILDIKEN